MWGCECDCFSHRSVLVCGAMSLFCSSYAVRVCEVYSRCGASYHKTTTTTPLCVLIFSSWYSVIVPVVMNAIYPLIQCNGLCGVCGTSDHTLINCHGLHGVIYVFPLLITQYCGMCEIVWVLPLLIIGCIGWGGGGGGATFLFAA